MQRNQTNYNSLKICCQRNLLLRNIIKSYDHFSKNSKCNNAFQFGLKMEFLFKAAPVIVRSHDCQVRVVWAVCLWWAPVVAGGPTPRRNCRQRCGTSRPVNLELAGPRSFMASPGARCETRSTNSRWRKKEMHLYRMLKRTIRPCRPLLPSPPPAPMQQQPPPPKTLPKILLPHHQRKTMRYKSFLQ